MGSAHTPHRRRFPRFAFAHYHHLGDVWFVLVAALILSAVVALVFQDDRLMSGLLWVLCVYTLIWFLMEWMYRRRPRL